MNRAFERTMRLWDRYCLQARIVTSLDWEKDFVIFFLVEQFTAHGCGDDRGRIYTLYVLGSNVESNSECVEKPTNLQWRKSNVIYMDVDYALDVLVT